MSDEHGISQAARKAREWTETRNQRIRTAHAAGLSLRAIAAQAGLTHGAIAKILNR